MEVTVVGAGLAAGTAAATLKEKGHTIQVFECRPHIAGNCFDSSIKGIQVHNYGPHAFHTDQQYVWDFVNKYADFNNFKHTVIARLRDDKVIPIPYNLASQDIVGDWSSEEILEQLFVDYSEKHWGIPFDKLPKSISGRVPKKRNDRNPYYHTDEFQGVPIGGYTQFITNMFDGCEVHLGCDPDEWKKYPYDLLIYTGSIDQYYDYCYGPLAYRSLRFEIFEDQRTPWVQLNECNKSVKHTRTVDHSHWYDQDVKKSVFTREFSEEFSLDNPTTDRFYPKPFESQEVYNKYKELPKDNVIFLGRLGTYKYLDMDDCIKQALTILKKYD